MIQLDRPPEYIIKKMKILIFFLFLIATMCTKRITASQEDFARLAFSRIPAVAFGVKCLDGVLLLQSPFLSGPNPSNDSGNRIVKDHRKSIHRIGRRIVVIAVGIEADCQYVLRVIKNIVRQHTSTAGEDLLSLNSISDDIVSTLDEDNKVDNRPVVCKLLLSIVPIDYSEHTHLQPNDHRQFELYEVDCMSRAHREVSSSLICPAVDSSSLLPPGALQPSGGLLHSLTALNAPSNATCADTCIAIQKLMSANSTDSVKNDVMDIDTDIASSARSPSSSSRPPPSTSHSNTHSTSSFRVWTKFRLLTKAGITEL